MTDSECRPDDFDLLLSSLCDSGLSPQELADSMGCCGRAANCAAVTSSTWEFTPPSTT